MIREIDRFQANTDDGKPYTIVLYQHFRTWTPLSGDPQQIATTREYRTSTGLAVNVIDDNAGLSRSSKPMKLSGSDDTGALIHRRLLSGPTNTPASTSSPCRWSCHISLGSIRHAGSAWPQAATNLASPLGCTS